MNKQAYRLTSTLPHKLGETPLKQYNEATERMIAALSRLSQSTWRSELVTTLGTDFAGVQCEIVATRQPHFDDITCQRIDKVRLPESVWPL